MTGRKSQMLSAAIFAGVLGMAAVPARAAEFGVYVQGPAVHVPHCAGPGYVGYSVGGYRDPGYRAYEMRTGRFEGRPGMGYEGGWNRDRVRPAGPEGGWNMDRDRGREHGWGRDFGRR